MANLPAPTPDDIRDGRVITSALRRILARAKAAGVKRPALYFESEGALFVLDRDHEAYGAVGSRDGSLAGTMPAVTAKIPIGVPFDVGAW